MLDQTAATPNAPDTVLGDRYQVLRQIAEGSTAEVHAARDMELDRLVALKFLSSELADDPSFVKRFRREVKAVADLDHSNIASIHDWGRKRDMYYIVMEYVDGRSLADALRSTGPIQPNRAAEIASAATSALACAHDAGLTHSDVTPDNIMIGNDGQVKVTGFGIAAALASRGDEEPPQMEPALGKAVYFSPEQAQGKPLDGRSDLYSLGVCLYEMVVGEPPFSADTPTALALKHVQETPDRPRDRGANIAESLEAIILKLLAKDPANRYPKAGNLKDDLERYLAGAHSLTKKPTSSAGPAGAAAAAAGTSHPQLDAAPAPAGMQAPDLATAPTPPAASHTASPAPSSAPPALHPAAPQAPPLDPAQGSWQGQSAYYSPPTYYYEEVERPSSWKRTAATMLALAALLGVLGFLGVRFYNELPFGSDSGTVASPTEGLVEVPDFKGLGSLEAEAEAKGLGFGIDLIYRINATATENTVFAQRPQAGERVEPGSIVKLTISRSEAQRVPPVRALTVTEATEVLENKGYRVIKIEEVNQAEVGRVFMQEPAAHTELAPPDAVAIYISTGPGEIAIPDVRNLETREAMAKLVDLGFRVAERSEDHETIEAGKVIDTHPTVGSWQEPHAEVFLITSSGPPMVQVPSLEGLLLDTGRQTLERERLTLGDITFQPVEEDSNLMRILSHDPPPHEEVDAGTKVDLVVGGLGFSPAPDPAEDGQDPDGG